MMVVLKSDLQDLIEKAWHLHDGLSNEIINCSQSFLRRFCLEHCCYCNNAETPSQDRQRLTVIRDSLKEVQNAFLLLQRIRSWQLIDRHAAVTRLEESRSHLVKEATQYQGRQLDVVNELNACLNINGKSSASEYWKSNEKMKNEAQSSVEKRRITSFVMCCSRMLRNSWNWKKLFGLQRNWLWFLQVCHLHLLFVKLNVAVRQKEKFFHFWKIEMMHKQKILRCQMVL